ncbi:MAG TPA: carbamoyltransferase, partial [Bacillota bacterium]|nr:carbamoyltransferase [Bacillota bacterium]
MILVGFYIGNHDTNIAVSIDGKVRYLKTERVTGEKHHKADLGYLKRVLETWKINHIDAIAFSDGNRNNLGCCEPNQLFKQVDPIFDNVPTFCIDHHYSHILSAWPMVPMDKVDVGVGIDGTGD